MMKRTSQLERRVFLSLLGPAALMPLGLGALACGKKFTCNGSAGLSPTDVENRARFAYMDQSSDISRLCEKCTHFEAGDTCGKCKVLAGPIHPLGTCSLFSPR